ncbi:MAG: SGNH/GDSL hydrolase family protein [Bacteroidota bacterium]|jgi:lysophospholipase L1-like esterase
MNKLILFTLFIAAMFILSSYRSDRKKKVLFFGDSITELGIKPNGYIRVIEDLIRNEDKLTQYELIGKGIGGNKIYDLYLRMDEDVLKLQPDIVVIYIGVNDIWHKSMMGTGTDYDKFGKFYNAVVKKIQVAGSKVILCTPAVIGERHDGSNPQDGELNHYSNWIRKYAAENNLPLVDLRSIFLHYSKANNPNNLDSKILTYDRVHLNDEGNKVVAEAMWKEIRK